MIKQCDVCYERKEVVEVETTKDIVKSLIGKDTNKIYVCNECTSAVLSGIRITIKLLREGTRVFSREEQG